jgi:glutamine synthetase
MQAEGRSSDCVLKPVAVYPDPARTNGVLVMCEVMMPDGVTPHATNKRATILDDEGAWFGFEQEYFFYKDGRPLGFPENGYPAPQGPYYTGVGYKNVGDVARRSSKSISTSASPPASTTKASTPKWRRASGNSRSSARARRRPPTRCGWRATCCSA